MAKVPPETKMTWNSRWRTLSATQFTCAMIFHPKATNKNIVCTLRLFLLSTDKADLSEESEEEELRESPFRSSVVIVEDNSTQETVTEGTTSQDWQANSAQEKTQPTAARLVHDTVQVNRATDGLIGTSEERRNLMDQVQTEYEASLAADQEKDLEKEANVRREALRMSRKNHVLYEPATHEPRVTVSVRHSILGVVRRAFPPNSTVMALYDWVGSLSTHPEHFALCFSSPHCTVYPEDDIKSVASSVLCMSQREGPMPLCRDNEEVGVFSCQSESDNNRDDTLSDHEFQAESKNTEDGVASDTYKHLGEVQSRPPGQLLEEDLEVSTREQENVQILEGLNSKRQRTEEHRPQNVFMLKAIDRHNCFNDMLTLYKQPSIGNCKLYLTFSGETAVGHGVLSEVYSVFWDNFVSSYCEGSLHFTFSVSAAMSQDDFVAIGCILTDQFIQTGTLPLQISEAIIQQAVIGQVSEECLIQSFLTLLNEKERDILQQALLGVTPFQTEEVRDILSNYGATTIPSPSNLRAILLQVSQTELISKLFMYITKLREEMGSFWDDVTADEIHAVYTICTPTHSNVLRNLAVTVADQQEDRVSRWLTRYIKSKDHKLLCRFIRFCTGSDVILPYRSIKVQLVNMSSTAMRPKAQTCFNLLTLPKNYRSLAHLTENIDFYLCNPHLWELTN